ncbi:MAG: toll/interleukin-1 receptor domain-containing protein, partial [Clostridia bacterium]|nr:toll/interleukin-1 receptor domain-containing protein [Clostridia bacterium]
MSDNNPQYDVFISYRHKPLDQRMSKSLHAFLETYKLPKSLKGFSGIHRVFRDEEELPLKGALSDTIAQALAHSSYLVVVCSPDTPESQWVNREVRTFIEMGLSDRIFALLIAGTPEQSFPPALQLVPDILERTLRVAAPTTKKTEANIKREMLRIIAACMNIGFNTLSEADKRRQREAFLIKAGVSTAALAVLGLTGFILWQKAIYYQKVTESERKIVMDSISQLTYELPDTLRDVPYTYPIVTDILTTNVEALNRIIELDKQNLNAKREKASNFSKLSDAWVVLGDGRKAKEIGRQGVDLLEELYEKDQSLQTQKDLGEGYNAYGNSLYALGQYEEAKKYFLKAVRSYKGIPDYNSIPWALKGLADGYNNIGLVLQYLGQYDESNDYCNKAIKLYDTLSDQNSVLISKEDLAMTYNNMGLTWYATGNYKRSQDYLKKAIALYEDLNDTYYSRDYVKGLADACNNMELSSYFSGQYDEGAEYGARAIALYKELAIDDTNIPAQRDLAYGYINMANNLNLSGNYTDAEAYYSKALAIMQRLASDSSNQQAQSDLANCYSDMANNLVRTGYYGDARPYYLKAAAIYEAMSKDGMNPSTLQY